MIAPGTALLKELSSNGTPRAARGTVACWIGSAEAPSGVRFFCLFRFSAASLQRATLGGKLGTSWAGRMRKLHRPRAMPCRPQVDIITAETSRATRQRLGGDNGPRRGRHDVGRSGMPSCSHAWGIWKLDSPVLSISFPSSSSPVKEICKVRARDG